MSVADRLLIGFPESPMIESNAERLQANCGKLSQVHWVFAENAGVHSLIEIHTPLDGNTSTVQLRVGDKPKVAYLRNDLLEPWRRDNVVVHQREVFLGSVEFFHTTHEQRKWGRVALIAFQLWHSTETALPDAASGCISKVGIVNRIAIADLIEDAVVRN